MARSRVRGNGRGGSRVPANPAPVSGPGALSARTDGGPGQPVRSFPAQFQGQRQGLAELQQSAPLAAGSPAPQGAARPDPLLGRNMFGPTDNPNEPIQSGIPFGPGDNGGGLLPRDPDQLLRALASIHPHPHLISLLRQTPR